MATLMTPAQIQAQISSQIKAGSSLLVPSAALKAQIDSTVLNVEQVTVDYGPYVLAFIVGSVILWKVLK